MLATIGFLVAALLFSYYGWSMINFRYAYNLRHKPFGVAYILLGLACAVWCAAAYLGGASALSVGVLIGNAFVLLATVFLMLTVIKPEQTKLLLPVFLAVAAALFYLRLQQDSTPYLENGVLVFDSTRGVALIISAIFLAAWLPVNLYAARRITAMKTAVALRSLSSMTFIVMTLTAVIFVLARKPVVLALSFSVILCCVTALLLINYLVKKGFGYAGR